MDSPPNSPARARAGLVALLLLSLGPPLLYYRAIVPGIDSARLSTGLLPSYFTFLRGFGFFSSFLPVIFAIALTLSLWKAEFSQPLFRRCTVLLLLFDACFLCCALLLIAIMLIIPAP